MAKLQSRIDGLVRQVQTLEAERTATKQKTKRRHIVAIQERRQEVEDKFKLVMRAAAGAAGLTLLLSPLVLISSRVVLLDVIAVLYCSVSFIMGAICLFIAIAYEKMKVWLGARLDLEVERQAGKENRQESDT